MLWIEPDIIGIMRIGMYPDGVFAALEHASEDGCQRAWAELRVGNGQYVSLQTGVSDVPIEVISAPFGVEPLLVEVVWRWRCWYVGMWLYALLKVFPHVKYYAVVVPPVAVVLFGFIEVLFPTIHHVVYYLRKDAEYT